MHPSVIEEMSFSSPKDTNDWFKQGILKLLTSGVVVPENFYRNMTHHVTEVVFISEKIILLGAKAILIGNVPPENTLTVYHLLRMKHNVKSSVWYMSYE